MIAPPATSAMGRFFLAFFSSALMEVAMIHPSYAKAVDTMAANSGLPDTSDLTVSVTVVKFSIRAPSFAKKPKILQID